METDSSRIELTCNRDEQFFRCSFVIGRLIVVNKNRLIFGASVVLFLGLTGSGSGVPASVANLSALIQPTMALFVIRIP